MAAPVAEKKSGGKAFDASAFSGKGKGPPKFVGKNKGIDKTDFPGLGDFPTIGQKESTTVNKADMSGSFNTMAKGSEPEPTNEGKQIKFGGGGGPPMFTSSNKNKNKNKAPVAIEEGELGK